MSEKGCPTCGDVMCCSQMTNPGDWGPCPQAPKTKKVWRVEWWRNGTKIMRTFAHLPQILGYSTHTIIDGGDDGVVILPRELFAEVVPVEVEE